MADRIGQQLGSYRLVRSIGQGGFAEVYLGEHVRLGSQAAVKVLHTRLVESDEVKHFQQEASIIANLEHPNIVRVLDFDVQGDVPFLIMGYAPHGNLRQRHPKGVPLPLKTIVNYITQVASALQYAHEHKVIHRDIKPENMLVGRHNEILLSDFGIALLAQTSRLQSTQEVAGTAQYMAPEQLQGKPRLASDQYALGIVVYEWLCGKRPFEGSFTEIASQHVLTPPPPLSEKVPTILLEVEQVVLTALEKDPHKRFGSVQAFATALEQACQTTASSPVSLSMKTILSSEPSLPIDGVAAISPSQSPLPANVTTPPISQPPVQQPSPATIPVDTRLDSPTLAAVVPSSHEPERAKPLPVLQPERIVPRITRRKGLSKGKGTVIIGLVLLILIISGASVLLYPIKGTTNAHLQATASAQAGATATMKAGLTATVTTAVHVYDNSVAANGVMFGFDLQQRRMNPYEHILNSTNVSRLRQAWAYKTGNYIESSPAVANGVVYVGSDDHMLYALDAKSGTKLWTYTTGDSIYSSPAIANGVVYVGSGDIDITLHRYILYALDAKSGAKLWTYATGDLIFSSPTVANGVVYVGSSDGMLYALDAKSGAKLWTYNSYNGFGSSPAVANGVVYVHSFDGTLYALDAKSGAKLWTYTTGDQISSSPAVANGVVYVGSSDHMLYALDAKSGAKLWTSITGIKLLNNNHYFSSSPTVANGVVYVGSSDGMLYALDARSGVKLWTYKTGDQISSSPTVANGVVYVGSDDHRLYAFQL